MKELSLAPLSICSAYSQLPRCMYKTRDGISWLTEAQRWGGGHVGVADRSLEARLVVAAFEFTHNTLFSSFSSSLGIS